MVSGDDSQFDGLWNRFSFVGLPQFKTSAFTETPADLGIELDKVYRSLSEQLAQTHWLSIESKPLWEAWHDEIEDKTLSGSSGLVKGTYAKFHGIAGRNALIIHRTLAAINRREPEQLISAGVMELALAWTKWELSQTLLQYQLLGLTNDPELSRILKFIDKFTGKGWVSAREVTHWWSGREKPNTSEIRSFMAKFVSLGYAIDNDEPIDSGKYRIQITRNGSNSSNKNPEANTHRQESLLPPLVTDYSPKGSESSQGVVTKTVTTVNNKVSNKIESADNREQIDDGSKTVTKTFVRSSTRLLDSKSDACRIAVGWNRSRTRIHPDAHPKRIERVGSRESIISRPSHLDPSVPLSLHSAPDNLIFRFAHVMISVTTFVNDRKVFLFPVAMIAICVMQMYPFFSHEFESTGRT
jgi:hypothetical protein